MELELSGWIIVALCAMMIGISKTGIPGVAILVVPMMAIAIPARESVGLLLGILILADIFAVAYHRHNALWTHVLRLLPPALAGIAAGYFFLRLINDDNQLKPIIGGIVLLMLGVHFWRTKTSGKDAAIPTQWWFALVLGFMAGVTTMMANAAGPVMVIYLLAMRLDKIEYVGTQAWFFFVVNWLKVPFSSNLNMMTAESVKLDLMMLPFIAAGAVIGIFFLKRIPQKTFAAVVQILAAVAAVKLLFF
ncbi:MAG: sulfite exporter TauE/SafE family protein [Planctomycetes bacterium]|nr:sulfite exporter TauE/SafE family protein [Planctomycetota bacterium]MBL7144272.1 sulfite exporter TauE/SafE family protein [Phycisphaerae bacterium]